MKRLLILRPQPGADATARRARGMGLKPVVAPLFAVRPIDWIPPDSSEFDAVLLTSANAARWGSAALVNYIGLPVFAVGNATAQAALDAGFAKVIAGRDDGAAIVALAAARGYTRLLHLAGREHADFDKGDAVIARRIVYASEAVESLPQAAIESLGERAVALLHSARAATLFGKLVDAAGLERHEIRVAGLSDAVTTAAGGGWARVETAPAPNDEALLAIAAGLCDQEADDLSRPEVGEDGHERL